MNLSILLKFLVNNSLFTFTIVFLTFVLGWILYNHVILRKINLRDSLFEKDNLAGWIEFIGAFVYPTLYLAAKSVEGAASESILMDLLISLGYTAAYIFIFTVLRLMSDRIIGLIGDSGKEQVKLNQEIYEQKNIAASLFSIVLSVIFVNIVKFLDFTPGYFLTSVFRMFNILILTLGAFIVYNLVLRRKSTLFKEIFIDNNPAAGIGLLGYIFASGIILENAAVLQTEFNMPELFAVSLIGLIVFGIFSAVFNTVFAAITKVDLWKEVYEQNNTGAAIGQGALYVGIANVVAHFLK